jgi:hypothetical protein
MGRIAPSIRVHTFLGRIRACTAIVVVATMASLAAMSEGRADLKLLRGAPVDHIEITNGPAGPDYDRWKAGLSGVRQIRLQSVYPAGGFRMARDDASLTASRAAARRRANPSIRP